MQMTLSFSSVLDLIKPLLEPLDWLSDHSKFHSNLAGALRDSISSTRSFNGSLHAGNMASLSQSLARSSSSFPKNFRSSKLSIELHPAMFGFRNSHNQRNPTNGGLKLGQDDAFNSSNSSNPSSKPRQYCHRPASRNVHAKQSPAA